MARRGGFTLFEMILVVAVIVALAGVIVPVVSTEMESAKEDEANRTVRRIATGLKRYLEDTQCAPTGPLGRKAFHYLQGPGPLPMQNVYASGPGAPLTSFLAENAYQAPGWSGPYLADLGPDPWGSAYVVNVQGYFDGAERIWVVSAGPNRTIDTPPGEDVAHGDDIAVIVE